MVFYKYHSIKIKTLLIILIRDHDCNSMSNAMGNASFFVLVTFLDIIKRGLFAEYIMIQKHNITSEIVEWQLHYQILLGDFKNISGSQLD